MLRPTLTSGRGRVAEEVEAERERVGGGGGIRWCFRLGRRLAVAYEVPRFRARKQGSYGEEGVDGSK